MEETKIQPDYTAEELADRAYRKEAKRKRIKIQARKTKKALI
jgi:hypothetical protein